MNSIAATLRQLWETKDLRKKLLFTAAIFFVFRLLGHVPVPSVNIIRLKELFAGNQLLTMVDMFSGGTLANFSIMAIGINPYITASIILQLATFVVPRLKEISKEGESGRVIINQWTRFLTVPIGIVQSISVLLILNNAQLILTNNPLSLAAMVLTLVTGSMIVHWLGELISMYGIGNGVSMMIFAGIVGRYPLSVVQTSKVAQTINPFVLLTVIALGVVIIGAMVVMNEAIRKVTIQYATRVRGSRTYGGQQTFLPLRMNQSGVLPIIFAVSMMLVPGFLGRALIQIPNNQIVQNIANGMITLSNSQHISYMIVYFILVVAFTYFSTAVFFNPKELAEELKQSGAFIPGVRPGKMTEEYLGKIITKITLPGAIFLGIIAVLPSLAQKYTGISTLTIGGTGLLIVVSVVLETAKQLKSQLITQRYEKYL